MKGLCSKNRYQQHIVEYLKRRNHLRKQVETINRKMRTWRAAIKRIEERREALLDVVATIEAFSGCSVKTNKQAQLLLFKYGIEQGLRGSDIARYLHIARLTLPSEQRLKFTRSFLSIPGNYQLWCAFRQWLLCQDFLAA